VQLDDVTAGRGDAVRAVVLALLLVVSGTGVWLSLRPRAFTRQATPDRNVLLVTIDTLRADALRVYGRGPRDPNPYRVPTWSAPYPYPPTPIATFTDGSSFKCVSIHMSCDGAP